MPQNAKHKKDILLVSSYYPPSGAPTALLAKTLAKTIEGCGCSVDVIVMEVSTALENESILKSMLIRANPYGDGHSAQRIRDLLHVKE